MEYPIKTIQFGARLTNDDLELLNEAIPQILPDTDLKDDKTLTGRVILMGAVENAISRISKNKTSVPADLEKIKLLEQSIEKLKKALEEQSGLSTDLSEAKEQAANLQQINT